MLNQLFSIRRYPEFCKLLYWRVIVPILLRRKGLILHRKVEFFGMPVISIYPQSQIVIGHKVSLCSVSEFTALGVNHPVVLRSLRSGASIVIGDDTGISGASICAAISIKIGRQCLIGANVVISDTDFHALKAENHRHNNRTEDIKTAPVVIGDNVFIGTGALILKGVSIGHNAIIGAGSVVTKNIPENAIAAGNPARMIGQVPQ